MSRTKVKRERPKEPEIKVKEKKLTKADKAEKAMKEVYQRRVKVHAYCIARGDYEVADAVESLYLLIKTHSEEMAIDTCDIKTDLEAAVRDIKGAKR